MYNLKREEINNITPISIESSNKKIFLKKINGKDGFTQNIILLQKNENNELINEYVFPLNVELNDNSYIDIEGIHINGSVIELSQEQLNFFNNIVCIEGVNVFEIDGNIQTEIEFNYVPLITEEIKQAVINNAEKAYIKVLATEDILDETNYLQEVKLNDERYVEGRGFIGSVIAKELTGKLINNNDDFYNLENKEIKYYDGPIMDNGSEKYFDYGTFIVQKPENDNVKDDTSFTAFDYMIKFNKKFEDRLDYSTGTVTVLELLEDICDQADVVLGTKNFRNSNFILENNQFVGGETCRDVLSNIAQIAFSWARINEDDELVLDFNPSNEIVETLNTDDYFDLKFNDLYGPINTIVLSNSVVTGENYTIHSPDFDPEIDEEIILEIQDNVFAYTEQKRYQLIQAGAALFGFQYVPITIKTCGRNYLNCLDKIRIKNVQNQNYDTYIFNNTLSYSGITLDEKKSPAMTNTEVKYEYTGDLSNGLKRTEIIVDKQEQKIESVISNVTQQNNKISQITQTVDEINGKIEDIADITISAESIYATISLERINQSEPIELKVHPTGENISYLYPHPNLFPSSNLYLKTRTIRFIRTYEEDGETLTQNRDYILPDDLLYYDNDTYDEFYLNYDSQTCQVIKRCKYNADGTVGLLDNETTTDYEYPQILLYDGDYEIKILGYNAGYISARLMAQNIYTTQFATKAEVTSQINQKADSITASVNQTFSNYSTTSQMNSTIQLKANQITSKVSANYTTKTELNTAKSEIKQTTDSISSTVSTKVGENEIISKINQSSEAVGISANKIELSANDVLNLLAGNTINLSSKNIKISSNNFNVDKNGNMTCSNANITGGVIDITDNSSSGISNNIKMTNSSDATINSEIGSSGYNFRAYNTNIQAFSGVDSDGMGIFNMTGGRAGTSRWQTNINMQVGNGNNDGVTGIYITDKNIASTSIRPNGIQTPTVTQTSKEENKKNFEKLENGLDIIKNTDIIKYNLKSQKDGDKKHIGFVIGKNYKYSKEITSENNDGVDTYSMISVAYKAIQEQQELIESLQKQIDEMKGDK